MISSKRLLYLQLYQAETLIANSKKLSFSDRHKDQYLDKLVSLFQAIKASISPAMDDAKIFEKKNHLDFIFKSLEFLKDSTLNTIPFEVVGCLDNAMRDWIDADKFIIVTSLQNNLYSFSYDLSYAKNDIFYKSLETEYGISFDKKLVQINLPLILSRDYLSSVALYHELGHFVDMQFNITAVAELLISKGNAPNFEELKKPLSVLQEPILNREKIRSHFGEHFSDIFAAQYIGKTIGLFLQYISNDSDTDSATHPSTKSRIKVIEDFVDGTSNPIVDYLQQIVQALTNTQLQQRFSPISSEDFYKLVPYDIADNKELHGVIGYGWNVWLGDFAEFNAKMGYNVNLSEPAIYRVVNSLVEKSIGNYFTIQNWEKGKA